MLGVLFSFCFVLVLLLIVFSLCLWFLLDVTVRLPDSFSPGSNIGPLWISCPSVVTNSSVLHFVS